MTTATPASQASNTKRSLMASVWGRTEAEFNSANMSVIRGTEVVTTLSTYGAELKKIAVDETRGYVYVTNADYASVAVFGFEERETALKMALFLLLMRK